MTELERKTAAIAAIAENFGKEITPALLKIWLRLLSRYTPEQVEAGVVRVIETYAYKTMPPYAVLREAIEDSAGTGRKAAELKAAAEWAWLQDAIIQHGSHSQPEEIHPTTAHVVRIMGGWQAVGMWETRYIDLKRREFVDLWTQADGKVNVLALGAAGVQRAIEQTHGGLTRIGMALPTAVKALAEKQGAVA